MFDSAQTGRRARGKTAPHHNRSGEEMDNVIIDDKNRTEAANGCDPLRVAPPSPSRTKERRLLALTRSTYADSISAPDGLAHDGDAGPASAGNAHAPQILELIAKANAHREGSHLRTDFNAVLLALALDPKARAGLGSALQRLVAAGLLMRRSRDEYSVTEAGALAMRPAPAP